MEVTELVCEINFLPICNVTVVIAIDETLYPLTLFDALKVILCIAHSFPKYPWVLFEVEICLFPTFHETVGSYLKRFDCIHFKLSRRPPPPPLPPSTNKSSYNVATGSGVDLVYTNLHKNIICFQFPFFVLS